MMAWLNPAALVAVAAAALPLIVHLLLRQRASRVIVPSVRFIAASDESAVRVRRPSDLWLLLVRMAIVSLAALALAGPVLITSGRRSTWDARQIRAVVVDTSPSVDAAAAAQAETAEMRGGFAVRVFREADLRSGIRAAAGWLAASPPGRLVLVAISDFHEGTIARPDFAPLPESAGIRTVRVASRPGSAADIDGGTVLYGSQAYAQHIAIEQTGTSYSLREVPVPAFPFLKGPAGVDPLARTLAAAGIFLPPREQPVVVGSQPESFETASALYNMLTARRDEPGLREHETQLIPASTLAQWTREPARVDADAWRRSNDWDGRWFWLAALALLGVEARLRRDRAAPAFEEAHAA